MNHSSSNPPSAPAVGAKESAMERVGEVWSYPQAKATTNAAFAARVVELERELASAQQNTQAALSEQQVCDMLHEECLLTQVGMRLMLNGDAVSLGLTALTAIVNVAITIQQPAAAPNPVEFDGIKTQSSGNAGQLNSENNSSSSQSAIQVQEGVALDERVEFERFYGPKDSFAWRYDSGEYKVQPLQKAWEIWQARAALATPAPVQPAAQLGESDPLSDFQEGQWWVRELDKMAVSSANLDQKRAVAVVHHMLRSAAIAQHAGSGEAKPVAYAVYSCAGVHRLHSVKPIVDDEWKSDDAYLGEVWGGNEALFTAPPAQPDGERDAALWRTFKRVLRAGHIPGVAHGRRFKIIETCPMYGDEKEFNDFVGAIDAAMAAQQGGQP